MTIVFLLSLSPFLSHFLSLHSTEPLHYKEKLTSHLQEEEGDWNLLEVVGMAEEAELIHDMADMNLLEKRAIIGKRKERARKELMKVKLQLCIINNNTKINQNINLVGRGRCPSLLLYPW